MKNYLTYAGGTSVQLHGFDQIGTSMSVSQPISGGTVILESSVLPQTERCFEVRVSEQRIVNDRNFYYMVDDFGLFEKEFIFNKALGNYFCI